MKVPAVRAIEALALLCQADGRAQAKGRFAELVGMAPDRFVSEVKGGHVRVLAEKLAARFSGAAGALMQNDLNRWLAGLGVGDDNAIQALEQAVSVYTGPANMNPAWSNEHCEAAQREGWDIFDTRGSYSGPWQIQRFDDASEVPGAPQLQDDEAAWRIVIQGTAAHHGAARQFIQAHNPKEWTALNELESEKMHQQEIGRAHV